MNQPFYRSDSGGFIRKDLVPFLEGLVGCDHQGTPLIACRDQFEKNTGFGLVLANIGKIIKDNEMDTIKFGEHGLKSEFLPSRLQFLHEIGCPGHENPVAILNECQSEGRGQMRFTDTRGAKQQTAGPLVNSDIKLPQSYCLKRDHFCAQN